MISCQIETYEKNQVIALGILSQAGKYLPAGRLHHFLNNWKLLAKDRWVLETVRGYCIEFLAEPYQNRRPHPSAYPLEQTQLITSTRARRASTERGNCGVNEPPGEILLQPIPGTKERWCPTPSHQPQSPESVCSGTTLQNGRDTHPEGDTEARRFASKGGPEGRLLTIPIHTAHRKYLPWPRESHPSARRLQRHRHRLQRD